MTKTTLVDILAIDPDTDLVVMWERLAWKPTLRRIQPLHRNVGGVRDGLQLFEQHGRPCYLVNPSLWGSHDPAAVAHQKHNHEVYTQHLHRYGKPKFTRIGLLRAMASRAADLLLQLTDTITEYPEVKVEVKLRDLHDTQRWLVQAAHEVNDNPDNEAISTEAFAAFQQAGGSEFLWKTAIASERGFYAGV